MRGAYARAKDIITSHRAQFDSLVARLLEKEVVEAAEIDEILGLAPVKAQEPEQPHTSAENTPAPKESATTDKEKEQPRQAELF